MLVMAPVEKTHHCHFCLSVICRCSDIKKLFCNMIVCFCPLVGHCVVFDSALPVCAKGVKYTPQAQR